MRLVDLAKDFRDGKITREEVIEKGKDIEIFRPFKVGPEEETIFSIDDGNSMLEVDEIIEDYKILKELAECVKEIRKQKESC